MLRRIVVVREHEALAESWKARSFEPAGIALEKQVKVKGSELDESYHAVRVVGQRGAPPDRPQAMGFNYADFQPLTTYSVRAQFADEEAIERLKRDREQDIVGVYADPAISVFPAPYCDADAIGTAADVRRKLGTGTLKRLGLTGRGVRLAVVDTGVNQEIVPVAGGWGPSGRYKPGSAKAAHGSMVAFDALLAAPNALIYDYALLQSRTDGWTAFLSDAIMAYADLMDLLAREPGPLVVNNSWGLYNRSEDAPIGSPENYSANPDHPFNQIVGSLVAAGADVFFAAGNCGQQCPDGRCGTADRGPGASIHGANSHPDVITVAAATVTQRRLGYSSQGPGGLVNRKPDLAAYSHFVGSGVTAIDSGTSAACPVAAGVAAAIREKYPTLRLKPAQMKGLLQRTARDVDKNGWDYDLGYGIIDPVAAVTALGIQPPRQKATRKK